MTCHTARFANPYQESFGEHFLSAPSRGAVGFLGTSGWGYVYQDELFLGKLYEAAFRDTVHAFGDMVLAAKLRYWATIGEGIVSQTMVDQYTLLGDPVTDLALPDRPDLAISAEDLAVHPERPGVADSVATVELTIHDFGLATPDSVRVKVTDELQDGQVFTLLTERLPPVLSETKVETLLPLRGAAGVHTLVAEVAADSTDEVSLENNSAVKSVAVAGLSAQLRWPQRYAGLPANRPLQVQVAGPGEELEGTVEFAIDTSRAFQAPLAASGVLAWRNPVTTWTFSELPPGRFYLRVLTESAQGKGDEIVPFRLLPGNEPRVAWLQQGEELADSRMSGLTAHNGAVFLSKVHDRVEVQSAGHDDGSFARILLNGAPVMENLRGYNVAVFSLDGNVLATRIFDVYKNPPDADSLAAFVLRLPDSVLVAFALMDEGSTNMNEKAYGALEWLGSQWIRSVGYRDSWAMLVWKGMATKALKEVWHPRGSGPIVLVDTLVHSVPRGEIVSPWIGPGSGWSRFRATVRGEGSVDLTVLGRRSAGGRYDTLATVTGAQGPVSRELIQTQVRWVRLVATFQRGRSDSSRLESWRLEYDPPADVAIGAEGVKLKPDSVLFGRTVSVSARVRNWGPAESDTCMAVLQVRDESGMWRSVLKPVTIPPLLPDSTFIAAWSWQVREPSGRHAVRVLLDPSDRIVELDETNNAATADLTVAADSTAPTIRLFADGAPLLSGDQVSPTPELRLQILDQGIFTPKDTSRLRVLLDDRRLGPETEPALQWHFEEETEGKVSAVVSLKPVLQPGSHILQVTAWDLAGNRSEEWFVLRVSDKLEISHVLNFPNPFADFTTFTYFLSLPADEVAIRVFTLAGRKVWETVSADGFAGYNSFDWDGRDQEGDELSNGVYLYKITARAGGKTVSALGNLAIVR